MSRIVKFCMIFLSIGLNGFAQKSVPLPIVQEEPFHRPVLETKNFTVIHLSMVPGDTSLYHRHCTPILYLTISGAEMYLEDASGIRFVTLPTGWLGSNLYSLSECFTHRISPRTDTLNIIAILAKNDQLVSSKSFPSDSLEYAQNGFKVWKTSFKEARKNYQGELPIVVPHFLHKPPKGVISRCIIPFEILDQIDLSPDTPVWIIATNLGE